MKRISASPILLIAVLALAQAAPAQEGFRRGGDDGRGIPDHLSGYRGPIREARAAAEDIYRDSSQLLRLVESYYPRPNSDEQRLIHRLRIVERETRELLQSIDRSGGDFERTRPDFEDLWPEWPEAQKRFGDLPRHPDARRLAGRLAGSFNRLADIYSRRPPRPEQGLEEAREQALELERDTRRVYDRARGDYNSHRYSTSPGEFKDALDQLRELRDAARKLREEFYEKNIELDEIRGDFEKVRRMAERADRKSYNFREDLYRQFQSVLREVRYFETILRRIHRPGWHGGHDWD